MMENVLTSLPALIIYVRIHARYLMIHVVMKLCARLHHIDQFVNAHRDGREIHTQIVILVGYIIHISVLLSISS